MLKTLNFNKQNIDKNREYKLGIFFAVIPAVIFAIILCNRTMPYAEGWYTYYAQLINDGQVVYKDFEYLFMPGYITFVALFTKIFGYSIIALRVLGVVFFATISYLTYKIFVELFNPVSACMGTIVTMFYLQSEVVQIFYDYIRFMDIFAYIAIFLLIKMCKNFATGQNNNLKIVFWAGFANLMVLMTKQNIGLLFGFYVLCYFIFLFVYNKDKKNVVKNLLIYGAGGATVCAGYGIYLAANKALVPCLKQTLFGAAEAKGGVMTILFNWIVEGQEDFGKELWILAVVIAFFVINVIFNKLYPINKKTEKINKIILSLTIAVMPIVVIGLYVWQTFSKNINENYKSYTYGFYTVAVIAFAVMAVLYIIDIFSGKKKYIKAMPLFMLLGAIFTIGYGVGMSGSLAASQIALSTGLIICTAMSICKSKYGFVSMTLVASLSMCFVVYCGSAKLVDTYNWWGLTDSTVWKATEITDVPLLSGIKVSKQEKEAYEGIKEIVDDYTTKDDDIFCFPHIPIVYSTVDRQDPGTFTKVQWFDVSTNEKVKSDIKVVEKNMPKVMVIYNIPEFAIKGHEKTFNDGTTSSTTTMYNELREYCVNNGYRANRIFKINKDCSITVWTKDAPIWHSSGDGTKEDPYIISNTEQFMNFSQMVNGGASFSNQYVALENDIDLKGIDNYTPIGDETIGAVFDGTFDGRGYVVKNLTVERGEKDKDKNNQNGNDVALFGSVSGRIINLGLKDSKISGYCVAGLVRYTEDHSSAVINCFVKDCTIIGKRRAGTIADDYIGLVYNCASINTDIDAEKQIGVVAYRNADISVEHSVSNVAFYHDKDTLYKTSDELNSKACAEEMNSYANAYTTIKTTKTKVPVELKKWHITSGGLELVKSK